MYVKRLHEAERLEAYSMPEPNSGCQLWIGWTNPRGYGVFYDDRRKQRLAHRASWEHHRWSIPGDLFVCHKCDVRSCINPDHLFLGTTQDNTADMVRKGRHRFTVRCGEDHASSRFTNEQISYIRRSHDRNGALAKEFAVVASLISQIRSGKRWAHIPLTQDDHVAAAARRCAARSYVVPVGEDSGRARLTKQQVVAIRADLRRRQLIAADYDISPNHVASIKTRKAWKILSGSVVCRMPGSDPAHNDADPLECLSVMPALHASEHGGVRVQEVGRFAQEFGRSAQGAGCVRSC